MYQELPWTVSDERLAQLRTLTEALDCAPGPGGSRCTDFRLTQALYQPVLKDLFPRPWTRAMVVVLYPSSQLVAHADPSIQPSVRYHIPLLVNEGCWVFSTGVWTQLQVGHVYAMHPHEVHGAVNWGEARRLHLAIDQMEGG